MQTCVDRLGIPLTVGWTPDRTRDKHGQIELSSRTLFLFDEKEEEAWQTLFHEILEFKLKEVLKPYRVTINALIEALEKSCYEKKEEFLEFVPGAFKLIEEKKNEQA
jgi:hypothetical protein